MERGIYEFRDFGQQHIFSFCCMTLGTEKGHLCRKIAFATVDASSFGTESNFALGIENHEREFVKVQYFEMEF